MRVVSVSPAQSAVDVVLGSQIEIVFDKPVDQATVTTATFALIGPGQTALVDADNFIHKNVDPITGREYITGTFSYPTAATLVFTPDRPLRPSVTYSVTVAGGTSALAVSVVKALNGEKLADTYSYRFTTGALNLAEPPVQSPIPEELQILTPDQIRVIPRRDLGNDLAQEIEIHFPADVDLTSLDPNCSGGQPDLDPFNDVLVSLDAIADDPQVLIPAGLTYSVTVTGNVMRVKVLGLPQ